MGIREGCWGRGRNEWDPVARVVHGGAWLSVQFGLLSHHVHLEVHNKDPRDVCGHSDMASEVL